MSWERWMVTSYLDRDEEELVQRHWFRWSAHLASWFVDWPALLAVMAHHNSLSRDPILGIDVHVRRAA